MNEQGKDFDFAALYKEDRAYLRGNSNLPGHMVLALTDLIHISNELEKEMQLVEQNTPGYEPKHDHSACIRAECKVWRWQDYAVPDEWNLLNEFQTAYLQVSPSEGMKRSNQTVQGFAGYRPETMEGMGTPSLMPRNGGGAGATIIVQNGLKEAKRGPRLGLGR